MEMASELQDEFRIRKFLLDAEMIRQALFEIARAGPKVAGGQASLLYLERAARELGTRPENLRAIQVMRNQLAHGHTPSVQDLAQAERLLNQVRDITARFLPREEAFEGQISRADRDRFFAAAKIVDSQLGAAASRNRSSHIHEVQELVFSSPGHFIFDLYERLNRPLPRPGFSYSSVWLYIQELVGRGRVLTVGGPKGVNRYCFPNPNAVEHWDQYYDGPFAVEAILGRKLTDRFDFSRSTRLVDVFEANSVLKRGVLLVTDMGRIDATRDRRVKSFGTLKSFGHLESDLGLVTLGRVARRDVLVAGGVDEVRPDGHEHRLWLSPNVESLLPSLHRQ
jgi:hypothetical protein